MSSYTPTSTVLLCSAGYDLDGPRFLLVGECYVHGLMNGEGLREPQIQHMEIEEIVLI